jgi:hypothetical protein
LNVSYRVLSLIPSQICVCIFLLGDSELQQQKFRVLFFCQRQEIFQLYTASAQFWGLHSLLYDECWGLFPKVKRLGCEAEHSPPSGAEGECVELYVHCPCIFMTWCIIKHKDKFTGPPPLHNLESASSCRFP